MKNQWKTQIVTKRSKKKTTLQNIWQKWETKLFKEKTPQTKTLQMKKKRIRKLWWILHCKHFPFFNHPAAIPLKCVQDLEFLTNLTLLKQDKTNIIKKNSKKTFTLIMTNWGLIRILWKNICYQAKASSRTYPKVKLQSMLKDLLLLDLVYLRKANQVSTMVNMMGNTIHSIRMLGMGSES